MAITVVSTLIIFSLLVYIHELGHFIAARRAGIKVEEFGFGFPPRLLTLGKRGDTLFTLNLIPVGGFVRMAGMPGSENPDDPDGFNSKSRGVRTLAITSGVIMNLLLAVVLFAVVSLVGEPVDIERLQIVQVVGQSPAYHAGLKLGDVIVSLDGEPVRNFYELHRHTLSKVGQPMLVTVDRSGRELTVEVVPRRNPPPGEGPMGIAVGRTYLRTDVVKYPIWQVVPRGMKLTWETVTDIWDGLKQVVKTWLQPSTPSEVPLTGVVGIGQIVGEVAHSGDTLVFQRMMLLTAVLSVNLAVFNLLPFPALDGGRLLFIILEWLRRGKRIDPQKEAYVHMVGIALLLSLLVLVSYLDIARLTVR